MLILSLLAFPYKTFLYPKQKIISELAKPDSSYPKTSAINHNLFYFSLVRNLFVWYNGRQCGRGNRHKETHIVAFVGRLKRSRTGVKKEEFRDE